MNKENIVCNEEINIPMNIQTNEKNDITDLIDQKSLLKTKESNHSTVHTQPNENMNLKYLVKYKEIYIPKIYLMEYNDTKKYKNDISSTQNANPYFNYGYNIEQWEIYADKIRSKFDELNEIVKKGKIRLPEPDNEMEYLLVLPSDFGGLGELYHEDKYENLKLYNPKDPENAYKSFMSEIKFDRKETWFPLKPNPESFTKKMTFYDFLNLKYNFFNLNSINMDIFNINKNNNISSVNKASIEEKDKNNFNKIKSEDKVDKKHDDHNDENKKINSQDDIEEEEEKDYNLKTRERSRSRNNDCYDDYNDDYSDRWDREDRNRYRYRKSKYYNSYGYNRKNTYRNNYKYYLNRDNDYYYDKYKNKKNYFKRSFKNYY